MTAGDAIASWLGALTDGGVLSASATAGRAIAAYVLGEDSLRRLRSSFERLTPEQARAEKIAVLETCLWMACSDRFIAPEEKTLLLEMIRSSGLSPDDQEMLEIEIGTRPPLVDLDHRLEIYELREMLLAMCWELAIADGRIDPMETGFFQEIRQRLEIDAERAREIQDAVGGQLVD